MSEMPSDPLSAEVPDDEDEDPEKYGNFFSKLDLTLVFILFFRRIPFRGKLFYPVRKELKK